MDSPLTAWTLMELGMALKAQGAYAEAQEYLDQAVAIFS